MAQSMVTRVVTGDVYAWMTPIEGVPGRYHHNIAAKGDEIEISADEAKRGERLGFLAAPDSDEAEAAVAESDLVDVDVDDEDEEADADAEPKRPARAANKATWAEFRGLSEEQAEALTVPQLQDDAFMASYDPAAPSDSEQPQG